MRMLVIVLAEEFCKPGLAFDEGFITHDIDVIVLDRPPESFDKNVVKSPSTAIHTDFYFFCLQYGQKLFVGKL